MLGELQTKTNDVFDSNVVFGTAVLNFSAMKELRVRINSENADLERKLRNAEQAAEAANAEYDERKKETLDMKKVAEQDYPMTDEIAAKYQELPDDITKLQTKIQELKDLADSVIDNQEAFGKFERQKHDIEVKQTELDELTGDKETREAQLTEQKNAWEDKIRAMVQKISTKFAGFFDANGCVGEIRLDEPDDYDQWAVEIWVKFRQGKGETLHLLQGSVQSGGERTVSTISYLMAIQSMTDCPFRLVDEINQGMDEKNERRIFRTIVKQSSGPDLPQYFLITPKLVTGLEYSEDVTILFIFNGFGAPSYHDWNVPKMIAQKRKLLGSGNSSSGKSKSKKSKSSKGKKAATAR